MVQVVIKTLQLLVLVLLLVSLGSFSCIYRAESGNTGFKDHITLVDIKIYVSSINESIYSISIVILNNSNTTLYVNVLREPSLVVFDHSKKTKIFEEKIYTQYELLELHAGSNNTIVRFDINISSYIDIKIYSGLYLVVNPVSNRTYVIQSGDININASSPRILTISSKSAPLDLSSEKAVELMGLGNYNDKVVPSNTTSSPGDRQTCSISPIPHSYLPLRSNDHIDIDEIISRDIGSVSTEAKSYEGKGIDDLLLSILTIISIMVASKVIVHILSGAKR